MSADDLRFAIIAGDAKAIAKAPGIGAKSAERIILDLKDKIQLNTDLEQPTMVAMGSTFQNTGAKNDAIEAMVALGYSASEAVKAVNQVSVTEDMDAGAILKLALKTVVR